MKQLGARPQDAKHMKPKLMPSHKIVWLFFYAMENFGPKI